MSRKLTSDSTLETLKKEAKRWLKASGQATRGERSGYSLSWVSCRLPQACATCS